MEGKSPTSGSRQYSYRQSPSRSPVRSPTRTPSRSYTSNVIRSNSLRSPATKTNAHSALSDFNYNAFKTVDFLLRVVEMCLGIGVLAVVASYRDYADRLAGWPDKIEYCLIIGVCNLIVCVALYVWAGLSIPISMLRPGSKLYINKRRLEYMITAIFVILWLVVACFLSELSAKVVPYECPSYKTNGEVQILVVDDAWCDIGNKAIASCILAWVTFLLWCWSTYILKKEAIGERSLFSYLRRKKPAAGSDDEVEVDLEAGGNKSNSATEDQDPNALKIVTDGGPYSPTKSLQGSSRKPLSSPTRTSRSRSRSVSPIKPITSKSQRTPSPSKSRQLSPSKSVNNSIFKNEDKL